MLSRRLFFSACSSAISCLKVTSSRLGHGMRPPAGRTVLSRAGQAPFLRSSRSSFNPASSGSRTPGFRTVKISHALHPLYGFISSSSSPLSAICPIMPSIWLFQILIRLIHHDHILLRQNSAHRLGLKRRTFHQLPRLVLISRNTPGFSRSICPPPQCPGNHGAQRSRRLCR